MKNLVSNLSLFSCLIFPLSLGSASHFLQFLIGWLDKIFWVVFHFIFLFFLMTPDFFPLLSIAVCQKRKSSSSVCLMVRSAQSFFIHFSFFVLLRLSVCSLHPPALRLPQIHLFVLRFWGKDAGGLVSPQWRLPFQLFLWVLVFRRQPNILHLLLPWLPSKAYQATHTHTTLFSPPGIEWCLTSINMTLTQVHDPRLATWSIFFLIHLFFKIKKCFHLSL